MSVSADRQSALREQALPARVASGVGLALLTIVAVWLGGAFFAAVLSIALLCGVAEFVRMARRAGHAMLVPHTLSLAAVILFYAQMPVIPGASVVLPLLVSWILLALLRRPDLGRTAGLAFSVLGLVYVIGLGLHLQWLRDASQGAGRVFAVLLGTWAADTAAFFVGIRWGRRRLAPNISPGKSIEGAVAGGVAALLVTAVIWNRAVHDNWAASLALGVTVGVAAIVGDLLESFMKRSFQVKDTSHLIPGHGGVLDRVDSLLLAGAAAHYVARLVSP